MVQSTNEPALHPLAYRARRLAYVFPFQLNQLPDDCRFPSPNHPRDPIMTLQVRAAQRLLAGRRPAELNLFVFRGVFYRGLTRAEPRLRHDQTTQPNRQLERDIPPIYNIPQYQQYTVRSSRIVHVFSPGNTFMLKEHNKRLK